MRVLELWLGLLLDAVIIFVVFLVASVILSPVYQYFQDRYEENDVDPFDKGDHIV